MSDGPTIPLFETCARCWRWDCSGCGPGRRVEAYRVLRNGIEQAQANYPKTLAARLLTCTYPNTRDLQLTNPAHLRIAHKDLSRVVQQLRRTHGRDIEDAWVTEPTKRGRIHLHVLVTGPHRIRKCTDGGRRRHNLPTGPGSGSPCYCEAADPCVQRIAHSLGMGWVKVQAIHSAHRGGAYLAKYLAKGANGFKWPRYARRMGRSRKWGSLTFAALRRQFIDEVRAHKRALGEDAEPPSGALVWELVPTGTPPLGVDRRTGEVLLPSRLR